MIQCFKDLKAVLDKHQILFWLEHGTLLGSVREGKIIDGDDDIDVSAYLKPVLDNYQKIAGELYAKGYDIFITKDKMTIKKNSLHATVYLYQIDGTHIKRNRISKKTFKANILLYGFLEGLSTPKRDVIHNHTPKTKLISMLKNSMMYLPNKKKLYSLILNYGKKIDCLVAYDINIPSSYVKDFKEATFYDMGVKIPVENEKYLEHIYGTSWRIPDKNWHPWKSFYKLMKDYNDTKDLLSHLKDVATLLDKHDIHFWMYGGALLGYVRDGALIPWDKDIDLFLWKKDYPKLLHLKKEFKQLGFNFLIREKNIMLTWDDKNIGIMYYELEGDYAIREKLVTKNKIGNMIYFGILVHAVNLHMKHLYHLCRWVLLKIGGCYLARQVVPSHFYLKLKEIDFFGITLKVPAETEEYLEYTFGKTWRTPIKDFKYNPEYFRRVA